MRNRQMLKIKVLLIVIAEVLLAKGGFATDITDAISLGGVLAGAYQSKFVDDVLGVSDADCGMVVFQAEVDIQITDTDAIYSKFGFASGNGLNVEAPFSLAPWAADLEDDVREINGTSRDYLLSAWMKHTFVLSGGATLGLSGGIIDVTDYLDGNAYANDEYTQFMNEALVNGPNAFLPSYDTGIAAEWEIGAFFLSGVFMSVSENDEGKAYNFYGLQMGRTFKSRLGTGTYRVLVDATSKDFSCPDHKRKEALKGLILSFDQELGEVLGVWTRFSLADDKAFTTFKDVYSGGLNISGKLWGREQDNIGFAYAHLTGGNDLVDQGRVAEAYLRIASNEIFAFTVDVQYQKDDYKDGSDIDGFIYGARVMTEF